MLSVSRTSVSCNTNDECTINFTSIPFELLSMLQMKGRIDNGTIDGESESAGNTCGICIHPMPELAVRHLQTSPAVRASTVLEAVYAFQGLHETGYVIEASGVTGRVSTSGNLVN
jgi:hypothetical protein